MSRNLDVNAVDCDGNTPLHIAIQYGVDPSDFKVLLDHGADVTIRNRSGNTPLHLCVMKGHLGGLTDYNLDIDIRNDQNKTAYDIAIENNNLDIAELIEQYRYNNLSKGVHDY